MNKWFKPQEHQLINAFFRHDFVANTAETELWRRQAEHVGIAMNFLDAYTTTDADAATPADNNFKI